MLLLSYCQIVNHRMSPISRKSDRFRIRHPAGDKWVTSIVVCYLVGRDPPRLIVPSLNRQRVLPFPGPRVLRQILLDRSPATALCGATKSSGLTAMVNIAGSRRAERTYLARTSLGFMSLLWWVFLAKFHRYVGIQYNR